MIGLVYRKGVCMVGRCGKKAVVAGLCESHRNARVASARGRILIARMEIEEAQKELDLLLDESIDETLRLQKAFP